MINQKGFKNIVLIILVVALAGALGYMVLVKKSTNKTGEIPVSDLCIVEKEEIIDLVNSFENAQMKRDARGILALFTPPELPGDSSTYVYLSGSDAAGPRLYSSGQTNFNQPSFKILETPSKNASGSCTTKVQEQRSYYPEGVGGDFGPMQPYTVYFVTVKQNNAWKIDRYLSDDGSTHKYSGWGY